MIPYFVVFFVIKSEILINDNPDLHEVLSIVYLFMFLYLLFHKGIEGENDYGQDPLGGEAVSALDTSQYASVPIGGDIDMKTDSEPDLMQENTDDDLILLGYYADDANSVPPPIPAGSEASIEHPMKRRRRKHAIHIE